MVTKQRKGLWVVLTIALFATGFFAVVPAAHSASSLFGHPAAPVRVAPAAVVLRAAPAPAALLSPTKAAAHIAVNPTFPRTVLVETFTGVWCHYCPYESQALYAIDQHQSHTVVAIAELHGCAAAPPYCLENYVPPDGTTDARGVYYSIQGYPTVVFDGQNQLIGQQGTTEAASENTYWDHIVNASKEPGNVSIVQTAVLSPSNVPSAINVSSALTITSGVNGTYDVITYLLEYINKTGVSNGYGPHSLAYVVRATVHNHPMTLTTGQTVTIDESKQLNTSWNPLNMSVISFVQDNRTKIVENANFAEVNSLVTSMTADRTTVPAESTLNLTVTVTNTSTGLPVVGAPVSFASSGGGSFSPSLGTTSSSGTFSSMFTAPIVTASTQLQITANVNAPGYTRGTSVATITVTPLIPPSVVRNVAVLPAVGSVNVNWSAPATGGGGVTYFVYTSPAQNLPFTLLTTVTTTSYLQTGVPVGSTVWYKIQADGPGGFAPNSTAVSATSVTLTQSGLPPNGNWWVSPGVQNFTVKHLALVNLFMGSGTYTLNYGPESYAFLAANSPIGPMSVGAYPLAAQLNFTFRPAFLEGTVHPADASVSIGGQSIPVSGGTFSWSAPEGTYVVNATAPGYAANSSTVRLTAGNQTSVSLALAASPTSGSGPAAGSLFGDSGILLLVIVGVVAVAVVVALIALIPPKGGRRARTPAPRPRARTPPRSQFEDEEPE